MGATAIGTPNAVMAGDRKTYSFVTQGIEDGQASFSATIWHDGRKRLLSSLEATAIELLPRTTEETPYGEAAVESTVYRFAGESVEMMFRLSQVPGLPAVLAQVGIHNSSDQPVNLLSAVPISFTGRLTGGPDDWLLSNFFPNENSVAKRFGEIGLARADNNPPASDDNRPRQAQVWEYGGIYRADGNGFLFGPVGAPVTYVNARVTRRDDDRIRLDLTAQMEGVQVDPGETRWGQQVILLMEPPQPALARWAEWVGKTHGARTAKGALSGWSSWYFIERDVNGQIVSDVADAAARSQGRLRPDVIQIDGGYEDPTGDKDTNDKFAEGLTHYATKIAATGARPGLQVGLTTLPDVPAWFDPPGWAVLTQRVRNAVKNGFTYLKLDFYGVAVSRDSDPKKTTFEVTREHLTDIRKAAGEDVYLLYCDMVPNRATIGLVDASRTGKAAARGVVRDAMDDVLRSYQLHNRWFAIDNCNYYMGTDIANVSRIEGGWPLVRTWLSMVGLSCGAAITSDPWQWDSFKPYWRNVEVMTPPAKEQTEVIDLGRASELPRLVGHVHRAWGNSTVALLWNPGTTERSVKLDFAAAGLDPNHRHAVWSFWDNRYFGVAQGSWTTPALAPSASQHICLTDLDMTPRQPVLVGSNLHIYCGAAEIKSITSSHDALRIELTDAGALDGDLFVYSRFPLVMRAASGCAVTGVAQAGEFMWRISLADRRRGMSQALDLDVVLPVTHRLWFWLLIGVAAGSLVFAASRYVAGVRVQRQLALDQERARIARDLHDEIGANLTHISILSTLAAKPTTTAATSQEHNREVAKVARQTILAFDEILWSINPENDTLRNLSHYLCRCAEDVLAPTNVACRFRLDENLPDRPVPPQRRHGMLLAVKESFHNILKHAAATKVEVECTMEANTFVVHVTDNGRGFDPHTAPPAGRRGHGLTNMRRRLAESGGTCTWESQSGSGTRVTFRMPID